MKELKKLLENVQKDAYKDHNIDVLATALLPAINGAYTVGCKYGFDEGYKKGLAQGQSEFFEEGVQWSEHQDQDGSLENFSVQDDEFEDVSNIAVSENEFEEEL